MTKNEPKASKKYLKTLGAVYLAIGFLTIIAAVVFVFLKIDFGALHVEELDKLIEQADGRIDLVKAGLVVLAVISGGINLFKGWLLQRAGKYPEKSILLLVLTVLGLVSGLYTMATAGFTTFGNAASNIVNLVLDILTFLAILNLRKTLDD